jgi:hypothetical protein
MSGYRAGGSAGRLVTKSAASGSTLLPSIAALTTVTTDSGNLSYGSWAQVVASSTVEYVVTGVYAQTTDTVTTVPWYVDLGTGGAGSESVKATLAFGILGAAGYLRNVVQPLTVPIRIPAGTRIAARVCATNTGGGNRNLDIALLVTPYVNIEGN